LNGRLCLRAGVRDGKTVLLESMGSYPLQVLRPHAVPESGGLSLVMLQLSAGLLDGDCVEIEIVVEPGARLALRTQAATQAHAGHSQQRLSVLVAESAWFSYVPLALVPHSQCDHTGHTVIRMETASRVLFAEVLAPGRARFGEEFAYAQVRLELDVWRDSKLVARERALVRPDAGLRSAQFGTATHTAGLYMLGPGQPPLADLAANPSVGWTALAHGGRHLRAVANRAAELDDLLQLLATRWWSDPSPKQA
jgi:urease accessory protein